MEQVEIEPLVSELEGRVDRLRSLYDMYFMGIERVEPLVPRKDVERRLAVLRREQIRNTGVRFRFQMIIQRYNTYVTYWQRVTRQIETGTFKRHVMRATARFGVDPAKEQVVTPSKDEAARAKEGEAVPDSAPVAVMPDKPIEEVYELDVDMDVDVDLDAMLEAQDPFRAMGPPPGAPPVPKERFASAVKFELDELADPFEEADPFPKPAERKAIPPRIAPRTNIPAPGDPVDGDLRIPPAAGSRPIISKRSSLPDAPPMDMATAQAMLRGQALPPPRLSGQPDPLPATSLSKAPPAEGPPRRPGTLLPGAGVVAPRVAVPGQTNVPVAPSIAPGGAPRVAPPITRAAPTTAPGPVPPRPAPAPTMAPGTMRSPSIVVRPATPAGPTPGAPPASGPTVRPAPVARPTVQPDAPPPLASLAPKPGANVGDLSGDRFGEIYAKYVETRRQHNEPTHAITRDALAKQLHESTDRLKQKTGAKAVDFEVVVKDGRTILRPIVK